MQKKNHVSELSDVRVVYCTLEMIMKIIKKYVKSYEVLTLLVSLLD